MMMIALRLPPEQGCFFRRPTSADSWTLGPKPLRHRHPTGPHPSGLLWTPWIPAEGDSTKTNVALGPRHRGQRQPEARALPRNRRRQRRVGRGLLQGGEDVVVDLGLATGADDLRVE